MIYYNQSFSVWIRRNKFKWSILWYAMHGKKRLWQSRLMSYCVLKKFHTVFLKNFILFMVVQFSVLYTNIYISVMRHIYGNIFNNIFKNLHPFNLLWVPVHKDTLTTTVGKVLILTLFWEFDYKECLWYITLYTLLLF